MPWDRSGTRGSTPESLRAGARCHSRRTCRRSRSAGHEYLTFGAQEVFSMDTLLQDLRFALRSFRRAPAFPLAAVATLALGIGATTAIFSTLNAVLLRPLPYPEAEDLYNIPTTLTDGRVTTGMLSNGEISRL